jgi:hypothetical protein
MFEMLDTALAFSLTMLAASLFVSVVVQVIQAIFGMRGRHVIRMVQSVSIAYRAHRYVSGNASASLGGDDPPAEATDERSQRFVNDILCDSMLHPANTFQHFLDSKKSASEADKALLCVQEARKVEYLALDDLYRLVERQWNDPPDPPLAGATTKADAWFGTNLAKFGFQDFKACLDHWFPTIEGTNAQDFKQQIRVVTLWVSCFVVVVLNMDGFELIHTLSTEKTQRDFLIGQAGNLTDTASQISNQDALPAHSGEATPLTPPISSYTGTNQPPADAPLYSPGETKGREIQKAVTILSDANIGLGWPKSSIIQLWAAYKGGSPLSNAGIPPTTTQMVMGGILWFGGLLFSCALLSLGAPFWVNAVSQLINLRNEVEQRKDPSDGSPSSPPPSAPPQAGPAPAGNGGGGQGPSPDLLALLQHPNVRASLTALTIPRVIAGVPAQPVPAAAAGPAKVYTLPTYARAAFGSGAGVPWSTATAVDLNWYSGVVTNSAFGLESNGVKALIYESKFAVDADGSSGDYIRDKHGKSDTSLHFNGTVLNSQLYPFIVLPEQPDDAAAKATIQSLGLRLGDLGLIIYKNGKVLAVAYGDEGPAIAIGEGSMMLATAMGMSDDPTVGGIAKSEIPPGVVHLVFPSSTDVVLGSDPKTTQRSPQDIQVAAMALYDKLRGATGPQIA